MVIIIKQKYKWKKKILIFILNLVWSLEGGETLSRRFENSNHLDAWFSSLPEYSPNTKGNVSCEYGAHQVSNYPNGHYMTLVELNDEWKDRFMNLNKKTSEVNAVYLRNTLQSVPSFPWSFSAFCFHRLD